MKEGFLQKKLDERRSVEAFRQLTLAGQNVDFCSNDYLGLSRKKLPPYADGNWLANGSTGSRLLSGNSALAEKLETEIAAFHKGEAALLFNSGYDANLGLLSAVVRKGDFVVYDQLSHASLRDGIRLGFGTSFAFRHNDLTDLGNKLKHCSGGEIFVVTEAVFSMDGDLAPLVDISAICKSYGAHLIVDEAHALGVVGETGEGLSQSLKIHGECFARVYTYGKAAGAHGAAIVGSTILRDYLVNFSRPFIFTTAAAPHSLQSIGSAYASFPHMHDERKVLKELIQYFREARLSFEKLSSATPIQGVLIPGNDVVRKVASRIQSEGIDVRPILYPTVPKGGERLRIVLHAYNTMAELEQLIQILQ